MPSENWSHDGRSGANDLSPGRQLLVARAQLRTSMYQNDSLIVGARFIRTSAFALWVDFTNLWSPAKTTTPHALAPRSKHVDDVLRKRVGGKLPPRPLKMFVAHSEEVLGAHCKRERRIQIGDIHAERLDL